ncbi:MAG: LLM class F420-dependent oxidoreductase [Mycobacterium sp.]|uniref:LLM class F420-dependent oxidoreductase n=1 Tax=Mycobacterium sp. TaxID=1785 RepID=UPI003BB6D00D
MVPTDRGAPLIDIARAVEERGLDGLWVPDHTHVPTSRRTPMPVHGDVPEHYRRNLEPLACLAMAAAVTSRIRLGTGVLLAAQRDPIVTAKALATIDDQSGGRLALGVGYGWSVEEMADHGVDPKTRRARTREHVLAMRRLWEDDVASYAGRFVSFAPCWSWPKPVQQPLPVFIGGAPAPVVFDHIAEFGAGWLPIGGHRLGDSVRRLREHVAAAGRDPATLEIIPFTAGDLSQAKVDALHAAGATEIAVDIAPDWSAARTALDRIAAIAAVQAR